jgi:2,4-dienoyl-CoA reductase-like NADH-dependent reductase (Old Yellow Enzyme family)
MPDLFDKTAIGSLELANRSVRSATWTGLGDDNGCVTDKAVEFYGELARGGVGLIVTGYQFVMTNGRQLQYMIGNSGDGHVEGLSKLAAGVHAGGSKVIPQLVHCGARATPSLFCEGDELWGPSPIVFPGHKDTPREMSKEQIAQVVEAFAAAGRRAKKAGFDGVQLHGAHGYGINQFLSPAFNKRGDAYGGALRNRYRFLAEVLEAVRGAVGEDFPILIKLNGHDFVDGGLIPDESREIVRFLADDGIDGIEISAGSSASPPEKAPARTKILKEADEAYLADIAAFVKAAVKTPIITVGGIRSPKTIRDILAAGKADYVAMSRPFIREPGLINRWKSGDTRKAKCVSCNGCFETGVKGLGISCKVERELQRIKAGRAAHE